MGTKGYCVACNRLLEEDQVTARDEEGYLIHESCGPWAATRGVLDDGRSFFLNRRTDDSVEFTITQRHRIVERIVIPAKALRDVGFTLTRRGPRPE